MSWLRRNRWGLALVVPAFALALAANSSRLQLFWWDWKPHVPTQTTLGQPVTFAEDFYDFDGQWRRELRVAVTEVRTDVTPTNRRGRSFADPTPEGAQWVAVTMSVEADPRTVLFGCQLSILDAAGREAVYRRPTIGIGDLPVSPCVPEDRPGPGSGGPAAQKTAAKSPRPASYEVTTYVLAAADFEPAEVRLWWVPPRFVAVDVRGQR